jgi:hypothetical protein
VHARLVNVGRSKLVDAGQLGYPVCLVCGQSVSPLSSAAQQQSFAEDHAERCGRPVQPTGFFADIVADSLSLPDCESVEEAYTLAEALRIGAAAVLDMDREDLEVLVIRQPGSERADALLYDPMPGGSGLLEQICARFGEVVVAALSASRDCPSGCDRSCVDCFQTFRNAFFHRHLNRHVAVDRLVRWGGDLVALHAIPPRMPAAERDGDEMPVNRAEALLRRMLSRAAFPEPEWHKDIDLGLPLGHTRPDCFFAGDEPSEPGVCVYLDGLSRHIHGNTVTREHDRAIREELRGRHFEVIEIPAVQLTDRDAMARHFFRLARLLMGKDKARELRDQPTWFDSRRGDEPEVV